MSLAWDWNQELGARPRNQSILVTLIDESIRILREIFNVFENIENELVLGVLVRLATRMIRRHANQPLIISGYRGDVLGAFDEHSDGMFWEVVTG